MRLIERLPESGSRGPACDPIGTVLGALETAGAELPELPMPPPEDPPDEGPELEPEPPGQPGFLTIVPEFPFP